MFRRIIPCGRSEHGGCGLERTVPIVRATIHRLGSSLDRAGKAIARAATASVVYDSQRADAQEQLEYNLLFRWFVGLNMDEPVWVSSVFSKNRDRLGVREEKYPANRDVQLLVSGRACSAG